MANFQFGQDNVGSGWQVPSWYVQGMSQSPMAASIAGIGNSIAAFSGGYQAARQAERGYGLEQKKLSISEDEVKARKDYYEYLKGRQTLAENRDLEKERELQTQAGVASKWAEVLGRRKTSGSTTDGYALDTSAGIVPTNEPALPQQQDQYGVDPYLLMSGARQSYPTQFLQGYDPRISF